ncbi:DNA-deoxyinosine glycosylase [Cohnella yongneupensis]|uniref:DNA-deoxyinosine glycosylase n=1 Tax=Cohnella yongneupensis TaxID=425006 RepID=A0ABW0R645_9BACL
MRVHSFPPIIDERSRVLVLGSMPGVASLKAHQYYGNERNYMWRLLYAVFEGREPDPVYEERIAFARKHGVALWDVIASCDRPGSLDSDIKQVVPNDIPGLLEAYLNVDTLACNGTKSYTELLKHYGDHPEVARRRILKLPSTSPIPTPKYRGLEDRLEAWRVVGEYAKNGLDLKS